MPETHRQIQEYLQRIRDTDDPEKRDDYLCLAIAELSARLLERGKSIDELERAIKRIFKILRGENGDIGLIGTVASLNEFKTEMKEMREQARRQTISVMVSVALGALNLIGALAMAIVTYYLTKGG